MTKGKTPALFMISVALLGFGLWDARPTQALEPNARVSNCMKAPGTEVENWRLNWRAIRSTEKLAECIELTAKRLADANALQKWLGANGFKVGQPIPYSAQILHVFPDHKGGDGFLINGTMSKGQIKLGVSWFSLIGVHSMSVGVILGADGIPLRVSSTLNRL